MILWSCKDVPSSPEINNINKEIFPHVIEQETYADTSVYRNETWLRRVKYEFLYLGKEKDTIELNYHVNFRPPPPPPPGMEKDTIILTNDNPFESYRVGWEDKKPHKHCESSKMEIRVDTSTIVKNLDFRYDLESYFAKAHPVFIKNKEVDTVIISLNYHIPVILEAKDSLNNWLPIENVYAYFCGVGVDRVFLPPNEIAVTSVIIYKGDYETDLRLRLGNNLSKPFKGQINYTQFREEEYY